LSVDNGAAQVSAKDGVMPASRGNVRSAFLVVKIDIAFELPVGIGGGLTALTVLV
jgi:hypothetical protein